MFVHMISDRREQQMEALADKEYRDLYVAEHIRTGVAFQIRAMREDRGWTQSELGQRAQGMAQETISQLEDPDYGRLTLRTLIRLASALDVALIVRFAPFSDLVDWIVNLTPQRLAPPSFDEELQSIVPRMALPRDNSTEAQISSRTAALQPLLFTVAAEDVLTDKPATEDTAVLPFAPATPSERIPQNAVA
jgi:transcriptional regulator with XRE-family HTH domain